MRRKNHLKICFAIETGSRYYCLAHEWHEEYWAIEGRRIGAFGGDGFAGDGGGANLSGKDLSGANLSGANLSGANLSGADLTGAKS